MSTKVLNPKGVKITDYVFFYDEEGKTKEGRIDVAFYDEGTFIISNFEGRFKVSQENIIEKIGD